MLSSKDLKLLLSMKEKIVAYEKGVHTLETILDLTQTLENGLNSLSSIDSLSKELMRTEWWELEYTSALMMDNEQDDLTDEDEASIGLALQKMKQMIESFVNSR